MLDSNYLIINRHARRFSEMKIAGHTAVFIGSDGKVLDFGVLQLGDNVYAALLCDDVRNITFIIDKGKSPDVVTLLWMDSDDYSEAVKLLAKASGKHFSQQNRKINRYAEAVAEKLDNRTDCALYMYNGYGHAAFDTAPDYRKRIYDFFMKN